MKEDKKLEKVFSVSEYIQTVNIALKRFRVKVAGEVTELKLASSGHVYFSLKDKEGSVLNCVVWKSNYHIWGVKLEEGMEIVISGYSDIWRSTGKFSFKAESVTLKGEGALKKAYLALRKKLEEQGLFGLERKKPLPEFPSKIGIITSKHGAVINDFLSNIGKFGFKIKMIDARVEGTETVKEILSAIKTFSKLDIEVLVIMRGGGSLESLQAFNNETLVQAIANFPRTTIVAIGHDKDVPLASMVADFKCSTPTAAATLINEPWQKVPLQLNKYEKVIFEQFTKNLVQANNRLRQLFNQSSSYLDDIFGEYRDLEYGLKENISIISQILKNQSDSLDDYARKTISDFTNQFQNIIKHLSFISKTVKANDPEKNLALGYSLARKNGVIVKSLKDVKVGDSFDLQLKDGHLNSIINKKYVSTNKSTN